MAGIRSFVHVLGASVLVLSPSALAQSERADRGVFRTLGDAVASGLFKNAPADGVGAGLGGAGSVDACVMDASCVQPNDNITGFNAGSFSTAETVTVGETGTLNRFCAQFIFAPGGDCPPTTTDPSLVFGWTLDLFDVLPDGDVDESWLVAFDTDTLSNMTVSVSDAGAFPIGAFRIVSVSIDLSPGGGLPVTAGQTIAINPQWTGFGGECGNFFWASSSNVGDGTPSGDGQVLFDQSATDVWDVCEYVDRDLMVCLDIAAGPPVVTPDFSTPPSNDECDLPTPIACDTTFVQCTRFATANESTDPAFECETTGGLDPSFTGLNTVWYSVTPVSNRIRIDTCDLAGDPNFLIQVFRASETPGEGIGPCNLVLLACSDNDCNFGANVCLNDVVPGEELIVQVGAATPFDAVDLFLTVTCDEQSLPEQPVNDECIDASLIFSSAVPQPSEIAFVSGSTECASFDPVATSCGGTITGLSPGVWYRAVGDGTVWEFSTAITGGTDFDTQLNIYCGDCENGLICLGGSDDGPGGSDEAEFQICTEFGQVYYLHVHGFFDVGNFTVRATANADGLGGCTNDPTHESECVMFELECPPDVDIIESEDAAAFMEVCGEDINNGCTGIFGNQDSPPFIEAGTLPFTACGQIFAATSRDLDSYRWTISERSLVTVDVLAEFDNPIIFMSDSDDCENNNALGAFVGSAGTNLRPTFILNPGTYLSIVTINAFGGTPCGSNNDYVLRVSAVPLGRCCIADGGAGLGATFSDCCVTTRDECTDLGGVFGSAQDCGPVTYDVSMVQSAPIYTSVIGLPNEVVIDGEEEDATNMDPFGDEDVEFVDIRGADSELLDEMLMQASFDFKFFGELRDDIAVVSNGYLTFPRGGVGIISHDPERIPTPGTDGTVNDFIAPLWRDLDPSAATDGSPNGLVSMVLQGVAPARTLTVEYRSVPNFNDTESSNSFQVQLFEDTNVIRFLYNDIDPQVAFSDDGTGEFIRNVAIGVENQTGTVGNGLGNSTIEGLSTAGFGSSDALFIDFTPMGEPVLDCADPPTGCPGDCDGAGNVNFGDLVAMLFEFGSANGGNCDADGSGLVNFGDLVAALFLFGPCE